MNKSWQLFALVLFLAASVALGQDESESTPTPVRPKQLLVGYFGNASDAAGLGLPRTTSQTFEVCGHTNYVFATGWGAGATAAERAGLDFTIVDQLLEAKACGIKTAIIAVNYRVYAEEWGHLYYRGSEVVKSDMREFFSLLKSYGLLDMQIKLYLVDEPRLHGLSDTTVTQANADVRAVAAEFPELRTMKLAVIYDTGAAFGNMPGIHDYDELGFDDYGDGDRIFTNGRYESFKAALQPWQKIWLVPGGAFGQDPAKFMEKAAQDPQVNAVVAFIYFDYWGGSGKLGLRSNGLAPLYCRAYALELHPEISNPDCSGNPVAECTVNGLQEVSVRVGDQLNYACRSAHGTNWYSRWEITDNKCGFWKLDGDWEATRASHTSSWPAMDAQAGCSYDISYLVCGFMGCASDTLKVNILPSPSISRRTVTDRGSVTVVADDNLVQLRPVGRNPRARR